MTASAAGEVRRWPLPELLPDDPDRLELWLQAFSGRRRDGGETVLLDLETWQERCRELRERWPEGSAALDARRAQAPLSAAWHDARAREAEATGQTIATLWHLEQLARLQPDDGRVYAGRGAALAAAGDLAGTEAAYAEARPRGGDGLADWYAHQAAEARARGRTDLARWYDDRTVGAGSPSRKRQRRFMGNLESETWSGAGANRR